VTSDLPLYERDPETWNAYLAEANARQARKRVSAAALIRDDQGRILLVDPGNKPGWDLPGGMAEANESPTAALRRELNEELGIDLHTAPLLCMDWVPPHGPWDDLLAFVFDGGIFAPDVQLRLTDGELNGYEFCDAVQVRDRLRPRAWRRTQASLRALVDGCPHYLHDGMPG
jgi:8-oxo-dGTP pyrophosphatase MutT (NUDIX family)